MNLRQRQGMRDLMIWLLSLSLLLSPLLAGAHIGHPPVEPLSGMSDMPCHQKPVQEAAQGACPHCDETGISLLCDCCDQALSLTLLCVQEIAVGFALQAGETLTFISSTRSDPPPGLLYRPPIRD